MIFFLIMMASSSTEAWALPASTQHWLVSSSKVSMLSNSSFGRITVVGILLWHATKTWITAANPIFSSKWIQKCNIAMTCHDRTALRGRTTESSWTQPQTWVIGTPAPAWPQKYTKYVWCSRLLPFGPSTWASCQCLLAGAQTRRRDRWHPHDKGPSVDHIWNVKSQPHLGV